LKISKISKY